MRDNGLDRRREVIIDIVVNAWVTDFVSRFNNFVDIVGDCIDFTVAFSDSV